jgi:hypothetical protein
MSEPALTTTTRIAESAATPGIVFRECGNNPTPNPEAVTRIDLSKGLIPRLRRIWNGEPDPVAKPLAPRLDPITELKQKRELLAHLESQLAILRERTGGGTPAQTTPIQAAADVQRQYAKRLGDGEDLAAQVSCDLALLEGLLVRPGEGLITLTQLRISQLETELRPPVIRSAEHEKLIAAAEKKFKSWGEAHQALKKYEDGNAPTRLRHEYRAARQMCGINWGRVDAQTLQRAAEFALTVTDSK